MGSDLDGWCLDRCWKSSGNRKNQWDGTFPRTSRFQGIDRAFNYISSILSRFKGTNNRTQQQLELEIENMGGHLNAYTSVRFGCKFSPNLIN